jgi:pilus assembly protein Flp/PilA
MNKFMNRFNAFLKDEDGAQIIEYALIIAVVSITLIVALKALNGGSFTTFIGKVGTCLTTPSGCTAP